jgi:hypothetical protein
MPAATGALGQPPLPVHDAALERVGSGPAVDGCYVEAGDAIADPAGETRGLVAGRASSAVVHRLGLLPLPTVDGLPRYRNTRQQAAHYPPIKIGDVDCAGGKVVLRNTKNRSDRKLLLSRQALEIAKRNCVGRKPDEPLFPIVDARKTLAWINAHAGTSVQGHGLRATFASIAEELVSGAC